jgi:hypothetical protein
MKGNGRQRKYIKNTNTNVDDGFNVEPINSTNQNDAGDENDPFSQPARNRETAYG